MKRFGWCMPSMPQSQHERCMVRSKTNKQLVCDCPCKNHGTKFEEQTGASEHMQAIIDKYAKES